MFKTCLLLQACFLNGSVPLDTTYTKTKLFIAVLQILLTISYVITTTTVCFSSFICTFVVADLLIGVHCTHGINRTGLMVCRYLIEYANWSPMDAIEGCCFLKEITCCYLIEYLEFQRARGHRIERQQYIDALHSYVSLQPPIHSTTCYRKSYNNHYYANYSAYQQNHNYNQHQTIPSSSSSSSAMHRFNQPSRINTRRCMFPYCLAFNECIFSDI
jgi:hypothetical protein